MRSEMKQLFKGKIPPLITGLGMLVKRGAISRGVRIK
jgi:hypothetical protein